MLNKHPVAGNTKNITSADHTLRQNIEREFNYETENGKVGMLLAVKAFVQLFFNPIVGNFSGKFGYSNMIFIGTINLLLASISESYNFSEIFMGVLNSIIYFLSFCNRRVVHNVIYCSSYRRGWISLYQRLWDEFNCARERFSNKLLQHL